MDMLKVPICFDSWLQDLLRHVFEHFHFAPYSFFMEVAVWYRILITLLSLPTHSPPFKSD